MHTRAHNRTAVAEAAAAAAAAAPVWQRRSGLQCRNCSQQRLQDGWKPRVGQLRDAIAVLLQISDLWHYKLCDMSSGAKKHADVSMIGRMHTGGTRKLRTELRRSRMQGSRRLCCA